MGRERVEGPSEAFKSLFSPGNPFRRKPEPLAQPPNLQDRSDLGVARVSEVAGEGVEGVQDDRAHAGEQGPGAVSSRKRKKPISSVASVKDVPEGDKKQRKDEGSPVKRRKKRDRDALEVDYERRKLGYAETKASHSKNGGEGENGSAPVGVPRKRKGMEEGNDMNTEDPFDDEGKLLRTIFVGNLPLKTKRKALLKEFSGFGGVESIRLRSVPLLDTKVPRKGAIIKGQVNEAVDSMNAYVVFEEEQSARAALAHNLVKFNGNHIRVDMACPPRKKAKTESSLYNTKRTVFVGNLPFDVKDEEVYHLFCEDEELGSNVEAVRVIRDPQTSLGKGIAYVLLKTREAATSAVRRKTWKLRDRGLRLCHARSDSAPPNKPAAPRKRKMSDPAVGKKPADFFPRKKAAAGADSEVTPLSSGGKPSKSGALPYQGLRANNKRGGVQKKASRSAGGRQSPFQPPRSAPPARNSNPAKSKRPAVAARKAKALRDLGKKRKQERAAMTPPDSVRPSKRARHRD